MSGESGSVVVDRATNKVYGHVVGSDPIGHAYVVSLAHVLDQVKDHLNVEATPKFAIPSGVGGSLKRPGEKNAPRTFSDTWEPKSNMVDATFAESWPDLAQESLSLSRIPRCFGSHEEKEYRQPSTTRLAKLAGDSDEDETIYSTVLEVDNTEIQRQSGGDLDTASSTATPKFDAKGDNPEQGVRESNHPSEEIFRAEFSKWTLSRPEYRIDSEGVTFKPRDKLLGSTANYLHRPDKLACYSVESPATGQQETYRTDSVLVNSLSYPHTSPKPIAKSGTASTTRETPTEETYEVALRSSAHAPRSIQMTGPNRGYNQGIKVSVFIIGCRGNIAVAHVDSIYPQDIVPFDDVPMDQLYHALVSQLSSYLAGDDCG
jgi:hypothetical protein